MSPSDAAIVTAARALLKSFGYFVDNLWHVRDVHFLCEQKDILPLTDQEAMEILEIANRNADAEDGLSWDRLEKALHLHLEHKSASFKRCRRE